MQLNSLTLNSNTSSTILQSDLAIYDHKLAVVNTQVFVFGKTIQNFSIQTPLHKINLPSLRVEPVFTINAPILDDVMMFSFQQYLYFWGKTPQSQKNQLYQFDGNKFTKMDQIGQPPKLRGGFSFTKFSHKYMILFGCLSGIQFQNKWYLFDIKKRQWKQIVSHVQIPVCQKSHLIWKNGRGYLLLQCCYDKNKQKFTKNHLYEIKFQNFNKLQIQLKEIELNDEMKGLDIVFTNLFNFDGKYLVILGGQQISLSKQKEQIQNQILVNTKQLNYLNQKIIFKFNLEAFQWINQYWIVPIKGQNHQFFSYDKTIYTVGGIYLNQLLTKIQIADSKTIEERVNFPYEQSLCYYCECAFTYKQQLIYETAIQRDYQVFTPKNRVENKFLKKLSQSISTQLHAIGLINEFLINQKSYHIQINLCEQVNISKRDKQAKRKIENQTSQMLIFKSLTNESPSTSDLQEEYLMQNQFNQYQYLQNLSVSMSKMRMASFKIGYGILYVTSTSSGQLWISYSSYSQTQFSESNFRSFSQIYYTVKHNQLTKTFEYSSQNNREIIFQNLKMHFGNPEDYQHLQMLKKQKKHHIIDIYVIGVSNLQKSFCIELVNNKYLQDLRIKSLNKKNNTNSLRKYLKHLYLDDSIDFTINLQSQKVEFVKVYQRFEQFLKLNQIKQIPTGEEISSKKNENEQTHFSTNQDQIISWKKIQIIDNCRIFEIYNNKKMFQTNIYNAVFIYHNKKLLKTITSKKYIICGVIQLIESVDIQLNGIDFTHKSDERKLLKWIQQIQNTTLEQSFPSTQQV